MKTNLLQTLENNAPVDYNGNRKRIFAPLHNFYGFDFNADFDVIRHNGKFTYNSICKLANDAGYTPNDSKIVVLIQDNATLSYRRDTLTPVRVERLSGFDLEYKTRDYRTPDYLDDMRRKSDFEALRKSDDITVYIVMQKNTALTCPYSDPIPDKSERFIFAGSTGVSDGRGNSWKYSRVDLITTDGHNYKFNYSVSRTNNRADFIDKSGYLVNIKRDNLKNAAEKLRRERAAAAFQATDNTAIIRALRERIAGLKAAMIQALQGVETYADFNIFERQFCRYRGFSSVLLDFETIETYDREKTFSSIAAFNNRVNDLNAKIDKILKGGEN